MAKKQEKKTTSKPVPHGKADVQATQNKGKFSLHLKLALILGAISFLLYANTLKNGFVLDDFGVIKENTIVRKGISAIPEILSTPYRRGYFITPNDQYRPLSLVLFAVEYDIWGLDPAPDHFITILLFAGCVIFLFLFLDKLFERKKTGVALIASLLFALHPIHTEVVANIKSCDELLCFFFAFLSLNVFLSYLATGKILRLLAGAICLFLSLLSKETAITLLAVIPMAFFFYANEHRKRSVHIFAASLLIAIVFLVMRTSVLDFYHANEIASVTTIDNPLAVKSFPAESRIATAILILGYYIRLLFVPYPLIFDYSYNSIPLVHFSDPMVLLSLAVYIFLIVFGVRRLLKHRKDPIAFAILFFLITVSLFTNIIIYIGTIMGERLMFFPSVGFCLAMALVIDWVARGTAGIDILRNKKALAIVIPVALVFIVITVNRNSDWVNNFTLYSADIKKAPNDSRIYYDLGTELEKSFITDEKDPEKQKSIRNEIIGYFKKSLAICPDFSEAECNLGYEFILASQFDSGEYHEKRSLELNNKQINAMDNLAGLYIMESRFAKAIDLSNDAIALNPGLPTPYINIAACYLNIRKYDSAIYFSNKAAMIDETNSKPYEFLAIAYKALGKQDSAKIFTGMAQRTNPGFKE